MHYVTLSLRIIHYIVVVSDYKSTWTQDDSSRRYRQGELVRLNEGLHA
jgi:hypothetical protein